MAAGDFSASELVAAQAKLNDMWRNPNPAMVEFMQPTESARALLMRQTATYGPAQNGNRTISQTVKWLKSGQTSITHNGTSAPSLDCSLENGLELESDTVTYTDNLFLFSNVALDDTDLAQKNMYSRDEIIAQTLMKAMNDIRVQLNGRVLSFLNSNKQPNIDTLVTDSDLGQGNWSINADLATIEIPQADAKNEDAIPELDVVLKNNHFRGQYFLLNGRHNWRLLRDVAPFKATNDDQRSIQATLNAYNMFWDVELMDSTLGGRNTFAVDVNSYVIINRNYSTPVPVSKDATKWEYYINDPYLMINDNGVMRPLRYEVVYQRICKGRNSDTSLAYEHQFEVKLLGQINAAPPGVEDETGIMKLKAV